MMPPLPSPERLERIEAITFADEFAAAPPHVAQAAGLGFEWIGDTLVTWAPQIDLLMFNRALHIGQSAPASEAELTAIASRYDARGVARSFLQVAPGAMPAELPDWLAPHGWVPHNRWAKFSRPLSSLPPLSAGVRVNAIGPDRADEFGHVLVEAFKLPPPMRAWEAALVGRPRWRHYLASLDGSPVGCAALFAHDGLASFGQAGTLEHARGRGVQGALILQRLHDAAAMGCTHAVVETAEDRPDKPAPSYRNQLRHGFTLCYMRQNYLRLRRPPAA